ncbi:MAG: purine-nucleoside phosphorylase [Conexivisphaerales archaeon]
MAEPQHIKAKSGEIAKKVVVSGDPARVKQLSEMLDDRRLVNENRGFLTYTGLYKGERLTVACHGVGAPSAAVVIEELIMLGAKAIVRLGSCGGLLKQMKIGDAVIATGAAYMGGTLHQYLKGEHISPVPDFELTRNLVDTAKELRISHFVGPVFSSDAFHAEDPNFVEKWTSRGYVAVEMECATLFGLSMLRKVKSASLLLVSDNLAEMQPMVDAEALKKHVELASKVVFNSLLNYQL